MTRYSTFQSAWCGVLACMLALFVSSCAGLLPGSQSEVDVKPLKNAHFSFIDKHTGAAPATWDQASFDSEVAEISGKFAAAETAEPSADRKQFIKNSAELFQRDANLVGKAHFLSASYAANRKTQLDQNYNLLPKAGNP